ncbi:MAG: MAPEG family protein [Deltaproteobacteria bacterium]|nr:MAPEG family protein [Deltaproteobacteria bacterium]
MPISLNLGLTHAPLYVGLLMGLVILLAVIVSLMRMVKRIYLGDGGDKQMQKAIRRHMNSLEHATVFCVLLVVFELAGGPKGAIDWIGGAAVVLRVLHAVGFGRWRRLTMPTMVVAYSLEAFLCGWVLLLGWQHLHG